MDQNRFKQSHGYYIKHHDFEPIFKISILSVTSLYTLFYYENLIYKNV